MHTVAVCSGPSYSQYVGSLNRLTNGLHEKRRGEREGSG
jgi:hypothetical protein